MVGHGHAQLFLPGGAWKCIASNASNASFSVSVKKRVSSFQVAAKSIFDIAAPALVGRVHTLHYIWQGRFVCSQIKAGCLYHFGGQAESAVPLKKSLPNLILKGGRWGKSFVVKFLTTHLSIFWHHLLASRGSSRGSSKAQAEALGIGVRQRRKIWLTFRRGGCNNAIKQFGMVK